MFQKFVLFFSLLLLLGCNSSSSSSTKNQKNLLLVSIEPYRFLTEQIAGPDFEVQTVVPGAANPHSYEPTTSQVTKMSSSRIWFCIGEPFEKKITPILMNHNQDLIVSDLRDGIDLIESYSQSCKHCGADHLDRHIWLSPKLASKQAQIIAHTLSAQFPEQTEIFQSNLTSIQKQLSDLDLEVQNILKPVTNRFLLVSHPAFGYFCKDYHLTQLSIEHEGRDPTSRHLEKILQQVNDNHVKIALTLPQHNNKGAQLIAEKMHLSTHSINAYSSNYIETIRKLATLIADEN